MRKIFIGFVFFVCLPFPARSGEFTYGPTREIFVDFSECKQVNGARTYHQEMGHLTWHILPGVRYCKYAVLSQDMKPSRFSGNNFGLVEGTKINLERTYIGPNHLRKPVKNVWSDDDMLGEAIVKGLWHYRSRQSPYSESIKNYTPFSSVTGVATPSEGTKENTDITNHELYSSFIIQGYLLDQESDEVELGLDEADVYRGVLHIVPSYYQYLKKKELSYSLSGYDYQFRKAKAENKNIDSLPPRSLYYAKEDEGFGSSQVYAFTVPKYHAPLGNVGTMTKTAQTLTPFLRTFGLAGYLGMSFLDQKALINGGVLVNKAIISNKKTIKNGLQGNGHKEQLLFDAVDSQWVHENKEALYRLNKKTTGLQAYNQGADERAKYEGDKNQNYNLAISSKASQVNNHIELGKVKVKISSDGYITYSEESPHNSEHIEGFLKRIKQKIKNGDKLEDWEVKLLAYIEQLYCRKNTRSYQSLAICTLIQEFLIGEELKHLIESILGSEGPLEQYASGNLINFIRRHCFEKQISHDLCKQTKKKHPRLYNSSMNGGAQTIKMPPAKLKAEKQDSVTQPQRKVIEMFPKRAAVDPADIPSIGDFLLGFTRLVHGNDTIQGQHRFLRQFTLAVKESLTQNELKELKDDYDRLCRDKDALKKDPAKNAVCQALRQKIKAEDPQWDPGDMNTKEIRQAKVLVFPGRVKAVSTPPKIGPSPDDDLPKNKLANESGLNHSDLPPMLPAGTPLNNPNDTIGASVFSKMGPSAPRSWHTDVTGLDGDDISDPLERIWRELGIDNNVTEDFYERLLKAVADPKSDAEWIKDMYDFLCESNAESPPMGICAILRCLLEVLGDVTFKKFVYDKYYIKAKKLLIIQRLIQKHRISSIESENISQVFFFESFLNALDDYLLTRDLRVAYMLVRHCNWFDEETNQVNMDYFGVEFIKHLKKICLRIPEILIKSPTASDLQNFKDLLLNISAHVRVYKHMRPDRKWIGFP